MKRDLVFRIWFEELFNRHFELLFRYAFSVTKDKYHAEEAVAEVFGALWRRKPDIDHIKEPIAYLKVAVRNSAARLASKNVIFLSPEQNESLNIPDTVDPEMLLMGRELADLISSILNELPPQARRVYELSRNKNHTFQEISTELGISKRTAEAHLYQVLRKFKKELRAYLQKPDEIRCILNKIISVAMFLVYIQ